MNEIPHTWLTQDELPSTTLFWSNAARTLHPPHEMLHHHTRRPNDLTIQNANLTSQNYLNSCLTLAKTIQILLPHPKPKKQERKQAKPRLTSNHQTTNPITKCVASATPTNTASMANNAAQTGATRAATAASIPAKDTSSAPSAVSGLIGLMTSISTGGLVMSTVRRVRRWERGVVIGSITIGRAGRAREERGRVGM